MKIRYNNKKNNLTAILLLVLYIMTLQMIDVGNGYSLVIMTFLQLSIAIGFSIKRIFKDKNILDPGFWFTSLFSMVNLSTCFFIYSSFSLSYYEPYRYMFQNQASFYLLINAVALIAIYFGNMFVLSKEKKYIFYNFDISSKPYVTCIKRFFFVLSLAIILLYYNVLQGPGLEVMAETRGEGQFDNYGNISYFIKMIERLAFLCSVSFLAPLLIAKKNKKKIIIFFILVCIYLFPSIYVGSRNQTIFFFIILIINYYTFSKNAKELISLKSFVTFILSTTILVVFYGSLRNVEGDNLSNFYFQLFKEMSGTANVAMTTIYLFPEKHNYLYGTTYLASILNLIPNIFFGGQRPFTNAALLFHELFRPDMRNHGFGFSMLAEAYMNGGIISVFLFFFLFSLMLTSFLFKKKMLVDIGMISVVITSTIWFLRSSSTGYLKILVAAFFLYKVITYDAIIRKKKYK